MAWAKRQGKKGGNKKREEGNTRRKKTIKIGQNTVHQNSLFHQHNPQWDTSTRYYIQYIIVTLQIRIYPNHILSPRQKVSGRKDLCLPAGRVVLPVSSRWVLGWACLQPCSTASESPPHWCPPSGGSPARGAGWHLKHSSTQEGNRRWPNEYPTRLVDNMGRIQSILK